MGDENVAGIAYLNIVVSLCGSRDAIRMTDFLYRRSEFTYQDIQRHFPGMPTENINGMIRDLMVAMVIEPADLKHTSISESVKYYKKILESDDIMLDHDWYRTTPFFENVVRREFPDTPFLEQVYMRAIGAGGRKSEEESGNHPE